MTTTTCNTCGLPEDLCVCEDVEKGETELTIDMEERSFNKPVTLISGYEGTEIDEGSLASELKSQLACGGTVKNGNIELQGDHRNRVEDILLDKGYRVAQ